MGIFDTLTSSAGGAGGLGAIGLGASIIGQIGSMEDASKEAAIQGQIATTSQDIFKQQMGINAQKQQQMMLNTQRQNLQNVRNFQRARAAGLTAAVSGGAQFGSGLSGAYGQQSGQANTNMLGTNQNAQIGTNMFNLTNNESLDKMQIAGLQGSLATLQGNQAMWQGISGMGGGLMGGAQSFGKIFGQS